MTPSLPETYRALEAFEAAPGRFRRRIVRRPLSRLPPHPVLIRVHYSSLNYKDALSASGNRGVTKRYPHTPGIDVAGEVVDPGDSGLAAGALVIASGFDLGMNTAGGFAEYVRVPASWVVALPAGLSPAQAMTMGTAGYTAAACVQRLLDLGVTPEAGPVVVSGASGGVGSFGVGILARLGFQVTAVSGKTAAHDFLTRIGARRVAGRELLAVAEHRALARPRWAAAVDTVGGSTLAAILKSTAYGGVVTCCGNAGGGDLSVTVYPFILRAVTLAGIDVAQAPPAARQRLWQRLAGPWRPDHLEEYAREITLEEVDQAIEDMLAGRLERRRRIRLLA